jgi:hypothetical protein
MPIKAMNQWIAQQALDLLAAVVGDGGSEMETPAGAAVYVRAAGQPDGEGGGFTVGVGDPFMAEDVDD